MSRVFGRSDGGAGGRGPHDPARYGDPDGADSSTAATTTADPTRVRWRWALPAAAAASVGVLFTGTAVAFGALGVPGSGPPPLAPSDTDQRNSADGSSGLARPGTDSGRASAAAEPLTPARPGDTSQPSATALDAPVSTSDGRRSVTFPPPDQRHRTAPPVQPADPGHRPGGGRSGSPGNHPMTDHWAELRAGGKALVIHFFGTPTTPKECSADYAASATETPDRVLVLIRARQSADTSASVPCPAIAAERTVTVRLDRPLGDRTVVRMPEGRKIPVRDR